MSSEAHAADHLHRTTGAICPFVPILRSALKRSLQASGTAEDSERCITFVNSIEKND